MSDETTVNEGTSTSGGSLVRFTATRRELIEVESTADGSGLDVARGLVSNASRRRALLRVQPSGHRRVDLWIAPEGLCAHNYVANADLPTTGASALTPFQESYLAALIASLLGPLPSNVPSGALTIDAVALRDPTQLANGTRAVLACWDDAEPADRLIVALADSGCYLARVDRLGPSIVLDACSAAQVWGALRDQVL
jgi:hypothetical protein